MGRTIGAIGLGISCLAIEILGATHEPAAQRPSFEFQLVIDGPLGLGRSLERVAKQGYTCGAVSRPAAPFLWPTTPS